MKTNTLQIASYNELNILQREMEHALDTRELIAILFKAIVKNIGISGLHYDNKEMHINGCDIDCHVSVDIISCTHECNCHLCPHADSDKCLKQEQNQPASGAA